LHKRDREIERSRNKVKAIIIFTLYGMGDTLDASDRAMGLDLPFVMCCTYDDDDDDDDGVFIVGAIITHVT
jgi:hypothetical protein